MGGCSTYGPQTPKPPGFPRGSGRLGPKPRRSAAVRRGCAGVVGRRGSRGDAAQLDRHTLEAKADADAVAGLAGVAVGAVRHDVAGAADRLRDGLEGRALAHALVEAPGDLLQLGDELLGRDDAGDEALGRLRRGADVAEVSRDHGLGDLERQAVARDGQGQVQVALRAAHPGAARDVGVRELHLGAVDVGRVAEQLGQDGPHVAAVELRSRAVHLGWRGLAVGDQRLEFGAAVERGLDAALLGLVFDFFHPEHDGEAALGERGADLGRGVWRQCPDDLDQVRAEGVVDAIDSVGLHGRLGGALLRLAVVAAALGREQAVEVVAHGLPRLRVGLAVEAGVAEKELVHGHDHVGAARGGTAGALAGRPGALCFRVGLARGAPGSGAVITAVTSARGG